MVLLTQSLAVALSKGSDISEKVETDIKNII